MTLKTSKKGLLSSGLPLEFDVSKIINELAPRKLIQDFSFIRKTDTGIEKDFSVDLAGTFLLGAILDKEETGSLSTQIDAEWSVLFECKHCRPGVRWIFLPSLNVRSPSDHHPCYTVVEEFSAVRLFSEKMRKLAALIYGGPGPHYIGPQIVREQLGDEIALIPQCSKAFELRDHDPNTSSPLEGIKQLQYGHVARIAEDLPSVMSGYLRGTSGRFSTIRVYSGVLVTTAHLHVLKRDINMTKIQDADGPSKIADEVECVELQGPYSPDLLAFQRNKLMQLERFGAQSEDITPRQVSRAQDALRKLSFRLESNIPSLFVVTLGALKNFLELQLKNQQKLTSSRMDIVLKEKSKLPST